MSFSGASDKENELLNKYSMVNYKYFLKNIVNFRKESRKTIELSKSINIIRYSRGVISYVFIINSSVSLYFTVISLFYLFAYLNFNFRS